MFSVGINISKLINHAFVNIQNKILFIPNTAGNG